MLRMSLALSYLTTFFRPISDELAKSIAEGYSCPISRSIMEDINIGFNPENINTQPLRDRDTNTPRPSKQTPTKAKTGLLNFFSTLNPTNPLHALTQSFCSTADETL